MKKFLILTFLLILYSFFLFQKIDLTTADLGRHLKNGEMILSKNFKVLNTNFYSYTQPNFSVINHHWLSGVIFYLIYKLLGFKGLHLFFIILCLTTFFIFIFLTQKQADIEICALVTILILPLVSQRTEVRPEVFSYIFSGIFFFLLWQFKENRLNYRWLFLLPTFQVFWVNFHIYFIFGLIIIGAFLLEELFQNLTKKNFFKISLILILSVFSILINPAGIKGALQPINIFQNYGYLIVENQSVSFLEKWGMKNPNFLLLKITLLTGIISFLLIKNKRKNLSLVNLFLFLFLGIISYFSIRNFTIFALFTIPVFSLNLKKILEEINKDKKILNLSLLIAVSIIFLFNFLTNLPKLTFLAKNFGLGTVKDNSFSADFFITRALKGPIFNNYDIGSYLIFYLFPKERVFVDNRPEAYSVDFFQKIYIPSQEKEEIWQKYDKKYHFNAIFFSHRDYTPWGQKFLIARLNDPQWVPVFVDKYAVVFLKRNKLNQKIIDLYEIPKERFSIIE